MINVYAGKTTLTKLPSPVAINPSFETIWSENTGRAQTTENGTTVKGKMIGDVIAEKKTYQIEWDMLTASEFNTIRTQMPKGFFYFAVGSSAPSNPDKYYRSEITSRMQQVGAEDLRYRDVSVSVIEQ